MVPLFSELKQVVLKYLNPQDECSTFLRKGRKELPVMPPHIFSYILRKFQASYQPAVTYKKSITVIVLFVFGFNFGQHWLHW
jgi:hypothetical protein